MTSTPFSSFTVAHPGARPTRARSPTGMAGNSEIRSLARSLRRRSTNASEAKSETGFSIFHPPAARSGFAPRATTTVFGPFVMVRRVISADDVSNKEWLRYSSSGFARAASGAAGPAAKRAPSAAAVASVPGIACPNANVFTDLSLKVTVTFAFGVSRPNSFGSTSVRTSPTTSSRPRSLARLSAANPSAGPSGSPMSTHRFFSRRTSRTFGRSGRSSRTETTSSTFTSASRFADFARSSDVGCLRSKRITNARSARKMPVRTRSLRVDMRLLLAPAGPDRDAHRDGRERHEKEDDERDLADVPPRERHGDLIGILRGDRHERLPLERPVRGGGQEQPVRGVGDGRVRRPVRVAEDDGAALLLRRVSALR